MGERRTIVIAGAGIGGLTASLALANAGYTVVVVERTPDLSVAGAGIQIGPNAGRALARLGLDKAIAAAAIEPAAIEVRAATSGTTLTAVPGAQFRERYGFPYRVIHRADLQAALLDGVRGDPAIRIELGAAVARHMPQPDGLLVRVAKGSGAEVIPAAALIGADGVWSETRSSIANGASPKTTGRTAWRAVVAADTARDLVAMDRVGLWLGPDAHLVHYPIARGAAVNIVATVADAWDKRGWSAAGDRQEIMRRFADWTPAARSLVAAPLAWQKYALLTVDPAAPWTDGGTALLGDAAHAMVPFLAQGAAMAIEDAMVLADCLYGATDVPGALRRYEIERRERVARVAAASLATGGHYHGRGAMAFARDLALRFGGERLILGRNDWIYRWQPPER